MGSPGNHKMPWRWLIFIVNLTVLRINPGNTHRGESVKVFPGRFNRGKTPSLQEASSHGLGSQNEYKAGNEEES